jgi:hypothetical protein
MCAKHLVEHRNAREKWQGENAGQGGKAGGAAVTGIPAFESSAQATRSESLKPGDAADDVDGRDRPDHR